MEPFYHLLFGSDDPFGQPYSMVAEMVEQLDCTPAEKEMIYHGNAVSWQAVKKRLQQQHSTILLNGEIETEYGICAHPRRG